MSSDRARPANLDPEVLADLVEAVASRRDRDAFLRLFEHFAPRLKGYLMRLGADPVQAEELAQDALLALWQKAWRFDRRQSSVATWLFTIVRNRRIDVLRRARRPELDPEDPALVPAAPAAPDQAHDAAERDARLQRAMAELPAAQRELLLLAFYEDKSHREIAAERGLPLGTVKSRLRLALARLRRSLERDG